MNKKELLWLVGSIITICILNFILLGWDSLQNTAHTDINIHDTYFVLPKSFFFILYFVLFLFLVYLVRVLIKRFRNMFGNVVFMITTISFIVMLTFVIGIGQEIIRYDNTHDGLVTHDPVKDFMTKVFNVSRILQALLCVFLSFTGIQTGKILSLKKVANATPDQK